MPFRVYVKQNKHNGKRYAGKTEQSVQKRWVLHCSRAKTGTHRDYFQQAIQKYGPETFDTVELWELPTRDLMVGYEKALIRDYDLRNKDKGYNLTVGGDGIGGWKHTEEAKRRIGAASKGNRYAAKLTPNQVRQIRTLLAAGIKQKEIAASFQVDPSVISGINIGRSHKGVPYY